jgi:hypothetical protein
MDNKLQSYPQSRQFCLFLLRQNGPDQSSFMPHLRFVISQHNFKNKKRIFMLFCYFFSKTLKKTSIYFVVFKIINTLGQVNI